MPLICPKVLNTLFSYAISLATQYGARITFLHVLMKTPSIIDSSGAMGYIGEKRWQELQQKHQQDAKDALIGNAGINPNYGIKENRLLHIVTTCYALAKHFVKKRTIFLLTIQTRSLMESHLNRHRQ